MKKQSGFFGSLVLTACAFMASPIAAFAYDGSAGIALDTPRLPGDLEEIGKAPAALQEGPLRLALVVREEVNGVTIIRNVRNTGINVGVTDRPVLEDKYIGRTDFLKPVYILSDEDLENCKRRLRTVGERRSIAVDGAVYCE